MPNAGDVSATYCPSCGASIEMDGDRGTCTYCGTTVERPHAAGRRPVPPVVMRSSVTSPRGSCIGTLIAVFVVAIVAAVAVLVFLSGRPAGQIGGLVGSVMPVTAGPVVVSPTDGPLRPGMISDLVAALPQDGPGYDLLVYLDNPDDDTYSLGMIDGGSQSLRWQSQPLSKEVAQGRLIPGPALVYLTDQSRLLALRLSDGTVAWQTSLVAEPAIGCDECVRLLNDRVIVLQKDGSLQAFDAKSGQLTWSTRLADTPRRLPLAGGRLVTLQRTEGNRSTIISFLDPADGKTVQQIEPVCPRDFPSDGERPDPFSPLLFSPDGTAMYTLYGTFSTCAHRWELPDGKQSWLTAVERDTLPTRGHDDPLLLADTALYGSSDGILWALNTADGTYGNLLEDKEFQFVPLVTRDDTLIVLTWPTWDTERQSLWGLDRATGARRWQYALQASDPWFLETLGDWDFRLTEKGLVVIQVPEDQQQIVVETLDPLTGVSSGQLVTALEGPGSHVLWNLFWSDDTAWMEIGSEIYGLDLATGTPSYRLRR